MCGERTRSMPGGSAKMGFESWRRSVWRVRLIGMPRCEGTLIWVRVPVRQHERPVRYSANARHAEQALVLLLTVGGVPSVYAGDEAGFLGVKEERFGGDRAPNKRATPTAHRNYQRATTYS